MKRKTKFLAIMGVALITAGILELTVGDRYEAYRGKHCARGQHRVSGQKDAQKSVQ